MTPGHILVLLGVSALALALLEFVIRAIERRLLYHPVRQLRGTPADLGLAYEDVIISTVDGERLHAFWLPGGGPHAVLYCHGNGGNVSDWLDKAASLVRGGLSVLLFDYRGYGQSTGAPSDRGLFHDAEAAYREVVERRGVRPEDLALWGNSLGGPVAAHLARSVPCRGLVIEASPSSTRAMAARVLPWLPCATWFARARFDTLESVRSCTVPVLVIHGDADPMIPFAMGRAIWEAAPEPRRFLTVPGGGHSDTWIVGGKPYRDAVLGFIADPRPVAVAAAPATRESVGRGVGTR